MGEINFHTFLCTYHPTLYKLMLSIFTENSRKQNHFKQMTKECVYNIIYIKAGGFIIIINCI